MNQSAATFTISEMIEYAHSIGDETTARELEPHLRWETSYGAYLRVWFPDDPKKRVRYEFVFPE